MVENRILTNLDYNIKNYSNYAIIKKETRDIIDVPYFPAQNLVDVTGEINLFNPIVDAWIPFKDSLGNERLFGLLNRPDARFLFVELADNARYLQYRFAGVHYPQGKDYYSLTFDGTNLYLWAGECNKRYQNDLWKYNINENRWVNLNFSNIEKGINEMPSRRGKSNIVCTGSKIWIFGGETDILSINSEQDRFIVPLNDIWVLDIDTLIWKNYDLLRRLPHRQGNIVYIDNNKVKILIEGGLNDIGVYEDIGIWELDLASDNVSFINYNPPFTPSYTNISVFIDGQIGYIVNNNIYLWDDSINAFSEVKTDITTVNPHSKHYWKVSYQNVHCGEDDAMPTTTITIADEYDWDDNNVSTKTIIPPPKGQYIPNINIDNVMTVFCYGMVNSNIFNEATFILNHTTLETAKFTFDSADAPQERVYPALCYDRYRGRVWLFGGLDGTKFYNDLWYFDLGTHNWVKVLDVVEDNSNENYPAPRQKAGIACVVNGRYLYIIGGYSDIQAFNDFWRYDIETNTMERIYLTDNIPWGSEYFIFEWKDRLWLFNGEPDGVYRLFWQHKQFVKQPFLIQKDSISDQLRKIIAGKEYLETPIDVKIINDTLFIQNHQTVLMIDMESKLLTEISFEFGLNKHLWLDDYLGIDENNFSSTYINISPMIPLTKNQIPNSWFSKTIAQPENVGTFIMDYTTIGANKIKYRDIAGEFELQRRYISLDKAELLVDNDISIVGTNEEYPGINFSDQDQVRNKTIEVVAKPTTYPFQPWFLYNKYLPVIDIYDGAQATYYNEFKKRLYILYMNGNIVKINPTDMTFFTYFAGLWRGSAIGYHKIKNKFYCFGGLREAAGTANNRKIYMQSGLECVQIVTKEGQETKYEKNHCGFLQFDLNVNEMNIGSIEAYQREHKISMIDYSITKDYLIGLINRYLEQYEEHSTPETLEDIKAKIYTATQPLVDDLSHFDVVGEGGERPLGRAYPIFTQVKTDLYIFGGCDSYQTKKQDPPCILPINSPYFTARPGTLINDTIEDENNKINTNEEAKRSFIFDMEHEEWKEIAPLPFWLYLGSAIVSQDNKHIYIVGGYQGDNCSSPYNGILRYDIEKNSYTQLMGIPKNYKGRAKPILYWIDEQHLLIMYGYQSTLVHKECESMDGEPVKDFWLHLPLSDAWIYDLRSNIMYKAFEDYITMGGITVRDRAWINEEHLDENNMYVLIPFPYKDGDSNTVKMTAFKYDLTNGECERIDIIPTTPIINDFNFVISDESDVDPNTLQDQPKGSDESDSDKWWEY